MHRMLERQIAHHFGEEADIPMSLRPLFNAISDTYSSFDDDQTMLDRSLELSSKEFSENSKLLKQSKEEIEQIVLDRTEALHQEHAKLLASVNSLSVGIIIVDANDDIFVVNDATISILGLSEHSPTNVRLNHIISSLPSVSALDELRIKAMTELKRQEIKNVVCRDLILNIILSPVVLLEDETVAIGVVVLLEDITEAKTLERSRDEFFSIASHELRTPLTAIRGNASMILEYYSESITDPDMRQMIDDMLVSSERLIKIVNDFLDVSRLEQGRLKTLPEVFDIHSMIEKTLLELHDLAELKHITLVCHENPPVCPTVFADPTRVKQVVMNLVGNAIHYSSGGTVEIRGVADEKFLKISVTDQGVGIAKDQEKLLFKKFQQIGEKIHSRDVMSTGLGLYISRLMVELMGGKIQLEHSELGKGSTFSFTLPLIDPSSVHPESQKPSMGNGTDSAVS